MTTIHIRPLAIVGMILGLIGYVIGVFVPYPGREFSIMVGMVSIAIAAITGVGGGGS